MGGYRRRRSPRGWSPLWSALLVFALRSSQVVGRETSCTFARYSAVFTGGFMPKCTPNGDYEPIQCHDGYCWCVHRSSGRIFPYTRVEESARTGDMCDHEALGATSVDLLKPVSRGTWKDIAPSAAEVGGPIQGPSYYFNESASISVEAKAYLPPGLWPDFAIIATVRPARASGGFLFAVVDASTESILQFGLGIGEGPSSSTQSIDLWYSERPEDGSRKIAEFVVPSMVGQWSRLAVMVNGSDVQLLLFCQSYGKTEYRRSLRQLPLLKDSLLLVGHGGDIFRERFKGDVHELLVVHDPGKAATHCTDTKELNEGQLPPHTEYGSGAGEDDSSDDDDGNGMVPVVEEQPDSKTGPPSTASAASYFHPEELRTTTAAADVDEEELDNQIPNEDVRTTTAAASVGADADALLQELPIAALASAPKSDNEVPLLSTTASTPNRQHEVIASGEKGNHDEPASLDTPGLPGLSGKHGEQGAAELADHRGSKGDKGEPGIGEVGPTGPPGVPGLPGSHGQKGEKGDTLETTGLPGPQGPPGPPGPPGSFSDWLESLERFEEVSNSFTISTALQKRLERLRGAKGEPGDSIIIAGPPGPAGADGRPGSPGLPGVPGHHGEAGPPGSPGVKGEQGIQGPKGDEGTPGHKGAHGDKGASGEPGQPGPPGPPGPPGYFDSDGSDVRRASLQPDSVALAGLPGPEGPQGSSGDKGEPGEKGARGDPGATGKKGERGHQGADGKQGVKGDQGPPGQAGIPGGPGAPGIAGQKGERGADGIGLPGPPGPPGPAPVIKRGRGRYLATVYGSGSGDDEDGQEDAGSGLLKGQKGDIGNEGKPGQPGSRGHDGRPGDKGDKGEPGTVIREAEIAKGDKGDRGEIGSPGGCRTCLGFKGDTGKRGTPGDKGAKGDFGDKGDIGMPGFPGRPGATGAKGERGESIRGDKGDRGEDGRPGPPGQPSGFNDKDLPLLLARLEQLRMESAGSAGPLGPKGERGAQGAKGEPGVIHLDGGQQLALGPTGPQGPPGPPGVALRGPPGYPGPAGPRGIPGDSGSRGEQGLPGRDAVGAAHFDTQLDMAGSGSKWPLGTFAFVKDSEKVFVRVTGGWQMLSMGPIVSSIESDTWNVIPGAGSVKRPNLRDQVQDGGDPDYVPRPQSNSSSANPASRQPPSDLLAPSNATRAQAGGLEISIQFKEVPPTRTTSELTTPLPVLPAELPPRGLRLAALDAPLTGNMQGVSGADQLCYRQSRRAGLRGTFRAVLATRLQNMASLVHPRDRELPVTNIKGEKLFDSWKAALEGVDSVVGLKAAQLYSFEGRNVMEDSRWPNKYMWHGADPTGVASTSSYCEAWSTGAQETLGSASALARGRFFGQLRYSCNNLLAVLCIETTAGGLRR